MRLHLPQVRLRLLSTPCQAFPPPLLCDRPLILCLGGAPVRAGAQRERERGREDRQTWRGRGDRRTDGHVGRRNTVTRT